jgi:hypothetical protein
MDVQYLCASPVGWVVLSFCLVFGRFNPRLVVVGGVCYSLGWMVYYLHSLMFSLILMWFNIEEMKKENLQANLSKKSQTGYGHAHVNSQ